MDPILFQLRCPACGARLGVSDSSLVGEMIACPSCGQKVLVRKPDENPDENPDDNGENALEKAAEADLPRVEESFGADLVSIETTADAIPPDEDSIQPPPTVDVVAAAEELHQKPAVVAPPELPVSLFESAASPSNSISPPPIASSRSENDSLPEEEPHEILRKLEKTRLPNDLGSLEEDSETEPNELAESREEDEDFEGDENGTDEPFFFRPFFLFSIGLIAAILLTIILVLVFSGIRSNPSREGAELATSSEATSGEDHSADKKKAEEEKSEGNASEEMDIPLKDGETADLREGVSTEGFNPQGSGVDLSETDRPAGEDQSSVEAAATEEREKSDSANLSGESAEGKSEETSKEEAEKGEATAQKEKESDEEEETDFVIASPDGDFSRTGSLPELKNRPTLQIEPRMAIGVESIQFADKTLDEILPILTGLSGVPILPDWNAIPCPASLFRRPVSLKLEKTTVGEILRRVAAPFGLEPLTKTDGIVLTLPEAERSVVSDATFDVGDLTGGDESEGKTKKEETAASNDASSDEPILTEKPSAELLARLVVELLDLHQEAPDSPEKKNVPSTEETPSNSEISRPMGRVRGEGDRLIVTGTKTVQEETLRILEQLRNLRRLPQKTDRLPEDLIPETLGWENLSDASGRMTFHFLEPVSLREAMTVFGKARKFGVLWDYRAIASAGAGLESLVTPEMDDESAEQVLSELLGGLHLGWVIIGDHLVLVTSRAESNRRTTVEIHLYSIPASPNEGESAPDNSPSEPRELVRKLKEEVAPKSWKSASDVTNGEGEESQEATARGVIWIDPVSRTLLVRQGQPIQRQIRRYLDAQLHPNPSDSESPESPAPNLPDVTSSEPVASESSVGNDDSTPENGADSKEESVKTTDKEEPSDVPTDGDAAISGYRLEKSEPETPLPPTDVFSTESDEEKKK